ncbi:MAG TPA: hypothetical protein VKB08_21210 [Bradyrhizobium sp.]|nr:hypothetical protein [Bradyrhizobium sp.]
MSTRRYFLKATGASGVAFCGCTITDAARAPYEYLSQIYSEAMVFTPEGSRHLVAQVGASQVVLGTDHLIPWEEHPRFLHQHPFR